MLAVVSLYAQDVTGDWNSILNVPGAKLTLVFHIAKNANTYSATLDSPDQGAFGIPLTSVSSVQDSLVMTHGMARIRYEGVFINNDSISGTFTQAGQSFPLGLSRKELKKPVVKRPQNPLPPYPYISEEVTFIHPVGNFKLAGTLTYPASGSKFPAVILITGSGPQNRDEELLGHRPFLIWADYLTRHGIAVLRFDDRGCFQSKGDYASATSFDFATDAEAAIAYLKTRKEIDKKKIGLMGHSEGGLIAPLVASRDKDVAFIVMLAGPGISGKDILLRQQELIARAEGMDESDIAANAETNRNIFDKVETLQNNDSLRKALDIYLRKRVHESSSKVVPKGINADDFIEMELKMIVNPWMLNFIRYNPAPALSEVKCPVLAIIGSKDLQVPANADIPAIQSALKKGGNKNYMVKELTGLNHLFQECKTGLPNEYGSIEQTVSPVALETVTSWLQSLLKLK